MPSLLAHPVAVCRLAPARNALLQAKQAGTNVLLRALVDLVVDIVAPRIDRDAFSFQGHVVAAYRSLPLISQRCSTINF